MSGAPVKNEIGNRVNMYVKRFAYACSRRGPPITPGVLNEEIL